MLYHCELSFLIWLLVWKNNQHSEHGTLETKNVQEFFHYILTFYALWRMIIDNENNSDEHQKDLNN